MIVYDPNKHFLKDIWNLTRSYTMRRLLWAVVGMGAVSVVVCEVLRLTEWHTFIAMDVSIFSFLGIVLSILLVFRTNAAYDRWWEGRKQWGALVNHSRNLALQVRAVLPEGEQAGKKRMAALISNFAISLAEHLRRGAKVEELINLSDEDKEVYPTKEHLPGFISFQVQQELQTLHKAGVTSNADHINLRHNANALLDILGACERIKKTPIPFSYAVYIKLFISIYAVLMPLVLYSSYHLWTVPMVMMIFFAFIGVELMAEEIEEPFGLDCNDLPTASIAHTIKNNVHELLLDKASISKVSTEEYVKQH